MGHGGRGGALSRTCRKRTTHSTLVIGGRPSRTRVLIHLAPAGGARLELEADLNIDTATPSQDRFCVVDIGLPLTRTYSSTRRCHTLHLRSRTRCDVARSPLWHHAKPTLHSNGPSIARLCTPEWYDHSRIGASAKRKRTLTHYALEVSLGLAPVDPFLEAVSLWFQKGDTYVASVLANIERHARMHPVTIPTTLMLLQTLKFDSTRLEVLARLKDQLPKTERESLLQAFVFKKRKRQETLRDLARLCRE